MERRRGTQKLHPTAEDERAASATPDASSQGEGQRPQTPPQMPRSRAGSALATPDGPSMS